MFRTTEVEQYHELCLIALSQPLLEALATTYLGSPSPPGGRSPHAYRLTSSGLTYLAERVDGLQHLARVGRLRISA